MIAQLKGILSHKSPDGLVVDVQGVGYEVLVSERTLKNLPECGEPVMMRVYTHVNEGSITLIGFLEDAEKTMFKKLLTVSGIGPRTALQILSGLAVGDLVRSILDENLVLLTRINGIGKKTAERLIVELKDKVLGIVTASEKSTVSDKTRRGDDHTTYQEALSALMNLGYNRMIAEKALSHVVIKAGATIQDVLKNSLMALVK